MIFYFAWVDADETTFGDEHLREDEKIVGFDLSHAEGDFASLNIDVKNPRIGLLASGRKRWAWFAVDDGSTAGATPLFFGRLIGLPEDLQAEIVRLGFLARPADYEATKAALAETLKIRPYWDPLWLSEEARNDPDSAIIAYPVRYHIDRVTHAVTVSNITSGEDGTVDLTGGADFLYDSLSVQLGQTPLRRITVTGDVQWEQRASGPIDLAPKMIDAFGSTGSGSGVVSTFTGQGLQEDWPKVGQSMGGGWTITQSELKQLDGTVINANYVEIKVRSALTDTSSGATSSSSPKVKFLLWHFKPTLVASYNIKRQRNETLTFTLEADLQAIVVEPGDEGLETMTLSSNLVGTPLDPDLSDSELPIGDVRRRAYFPIDRGRQSIEYLIAVGSAEMLRRARAVQISVEVPFSTALHLSCRKDATIADGRLPGGEATGKIVDYGLSWDGSVGGKATLTIACTIGRGNTVSGAAGTPTYVAEGYVEKGYQVYAGTVNDPLLGQVTYDELTTPPNDDGLDPATLDEDTAINLMLVTNGVTAQRQVLDQIFPDPSSAIEALNGVYTQACVNMRPVAGDTEQAGPFTTIYELNVSNLMIPKTIDLEAASVTA